MYKRKTIDEYEIQGKYSLGWEVLCTEETWKDARRCLKDYNDNETKCLHRIVKKRVKIKEEK